MRLYNFEGRHGLTTNSSIMIYRRKKKEKSRKSDRNGSSSSTSNDANTILGGNEHGDRRSGSIVNDITARVPASSNDDNNNNNNNYFGRTLLMTMIEKHQWNNAIHRMKIYPKEAKDVCSVTLDHRNSLSSQQQQQKRSLKKETTKALPLHVALINKAPLEVIELLLKCYPKALMKKDSKYKRYPLHFACLYHSSDIRLIELLHRGNPLAIKSIDSFGRCALHYASFGKASIDVFDMLLKHYPSAATTRNEKHGWTPLHVAVKMSLDFNIIKLLVECAPSTILQTTIRGANVFHIARHFHGRESIVEKQLWALRSALDICYDFNHNFLNLTTIADATLHSYMMQQQQQEQQQQQQSEDNIISSQQVEDNIGPDEDGVNYSTVDERQEELEALSSSFISTTTTSTASSIERVTDAISLENDEGEMNTMLPHVDTSSSSLVTTDSSSSSENMADESERSVTSCDSVGDINFRSSTSNNESNEDEECVQEGELGLNNNNRVDILVTQENVSEQDENEHSEIERKGDFCNTITPPPPVLADVESHSSTCVICMDDKATHAFVPCGHLCACEECVTYMTLSHGKQLCHTSNLKKKNMNASRQCPVCRKQSFMIMRVYTT